MPVTTDATTASRGELPELGGRIERPRLMGALRARFDHRLTIVAAGAGFGKTTALTLAIQNNRLDPFGIDHWIAANHRGSDPRVFANSIARLLGLDASPDWRSVLDAIADSVWAQSPADIALVVDDAHLVTATREGRAAMTYLLEALPRNGHLVLGTRDPAGLPVARLEAAGDVLRIHEADLAFDTGELDDLRDAIGTTARAHIPTALPTWPALAALQLRAGSGSEFDYIWEEILDSLPSDRLHHLQALAVLPSFDDPVVRAVTDGDVASASELVAGLTGVTWTNGVGQLHALVREAILARTTESQRAVAAQRAGRVERERGRLRHAVELFAAADDHDNLIDTAIELAYMPIVMAAIEEFAVVHATLVEALGDHPIIDYFATALMWEHDDAEAGRQFNLVASKARSDGSPEVETIALWRAIQSLRLDVREVTDTAYRRMFELAETQPFARGATKLLMSYATQLDGDVGRSISLIDDLSEMGKLNAILNHAQRCGDLGRPELVRPDAGPSDLTAFFHAQAIWQRGEVAPADALMLAIPTLDATRRQGVANTTISLVGVLSLVALAAGDPVAAKALADEATQLSSRSSGASVEAFGHLASAALATLESDEKATALLQEAFINLAPEPFPDRAYLYALPLIYILEPTRREFLDSLDLGPSHTTALAAAQALVAVRDGRGDEATTVAWGQPNLLRAHLQPPHLLELAVAASQRGVDAATSLLADLPYTTDLWPRLVDHADSLVADHARRSMREHVPRPAHPLRIHTLGPLRIDLGPDRAVGDDWNRRERVRRLLAELVVHRRASRDQIKTALWPDLDDKKGDSNLRVNLSHLLKLLEPDRGPRTLPYYVRTSGDWIELAGDVWLDVDEFTESVARARELDDSGAPAAAMAAYEASLELFSGNYLEEYDTDDVGAADRLRVRSLAVGACARIGELRLAKGEPLVAATSAEQALRLDPLNERAGRLRIRTFVALDDRSAAAQSAQEFSTNLAEARLPIESETQRLFDTLGIDTGRRPS